MAALMKLRVIHVFTHDSIGLGEDGPTHQSVEHAASSALIPHLDVWRPCDTVETAVAWTAALEQQRRPERAAAVAAEPAARSRKRGQAATRSRAAATCWPTGRGGPARKRRPCSSPPAPKWSWRCSAQQRWPSRGIAVRVVSMPCTSVFDRQDAAVQAQRAAAGVPRVAIEAGVTDFWRKYVACDGASSASTASASRRRRPRCSSFSASRRKTSSRWRARSSASVPWTRHLKAGSVRALRAPPLARPCCVSMGAVGASHASGDSVHQSRLPSGCRRQPWRSVSSRSTRLRCWSIKRGARVPCHVHFRRSRPRALRRVERHPGRTSRARSARTRGSCASLA